MLLTAVWIGFLSRLAVAIWNGFFGPSFGADLDAMAFHDEAVAYAATAELDEFRVGWIYSYVLGIFYYLTTDSLFLGSLLSCVVWLASLLVLISTMRALNFDSLQQLKATVIYSLLPSSILLTSVTLREPYELLFVNLAAYSVLKIYLYRSLMHWLLLLAATAAMGVLHGALLAFGTFTVVATITLLAMRGGVNFAAAKFILAAPLMAVVALYGLSLFTGIAYNLDEGLALAVQAHQQESLRIDARANYKTDVEIGGAAALVVALPVLFLQYMIEPMPWRITATSDAALLLENALRAWLIWKGWIGLRSIPVRGRRPITFVFVSYLVIEIIWSVGTTNWGTAARHHLPGLGLLVIAAFAYPNKRLVKRDVRSGSMQVRRSA